MNYELRFAKDDQKEGIFNNSFEACLLGGDIVFYIADKRTVHFAREFSALYLCDLTAKICRKEIIRDCTADQFLDILYLISALIGKEFEEENGQYLPKGILAYRINKQPAVR